MRAVEVAELALGDIRVESYFARTLRAVSPAQVAQAESSGLSGFPLVRRGDRRLIAGRVLLATAFRAELPAIQVVLVECTDEEADALRAQETGLPRKEPREGTKAAEYELRARECGVRPESIRKREYRRKKEEENNG